jgi:hypothetical protein
MNKDRSILIHDVASLTFLAPFSVLCVAETFFGYTVYPMFLTHALTTYMSYDLVWIILQPKVVHTFRKLIILHHLVCLLALLRPLMYPDEGFIVSRVGLVEIDTSLLTIRRLTPRNSSIYPTINDMYHASNLLIRVGYETCMTLYLSYFYAYESVYTKLHILGCQYFINIFSCGICALTYSKRNPTLRIKS